MLNIYSILHQNIQDKFNEAGVEINSPHYTSLRDGNETTIPQTDLAEDYKRPDFEVRQVNGGSAPVAGRTREDEKRAGHVEAVKVG